MEEYTFYVSDYKNIEQFQTNFDINYCKVNYLQIFIYLVTRVELHYHLKLMSLDILIF